MARFCSLFSSSSGNCTYIGSSGGGVLIDAGVSAKQISLKLNGIGVSERNIGAVFVTHEHGDHVKGLRVLASKYNIPVYATEGTIRELEKMGIINGKFPVIPHLFSQLIGWLSQCHLDFSYTSNHFGELLLIHRKGRIRSSNTPIQNKMLLENSSTQRNRGYRHRTRHRMI